MSAIAIYEVPVNKVREVSEQYGVIAVGTTYTGLLSGRIA